MKKKLALLFGILGLLFLGCFSKDDEVVDLNIKDALFLENEKNYVVGDTIYFELDFSRYLEENGFSNRLDVYETTGALSFTYPMILEKFSPQSNGYAQVTVANNFIVEEKGMLVGDFNTVAALLDTEREVYESRIGVILVEPGSFRFSFDFLRLYPNSVGDRIELVISHYFTNFSPEDFEFEVTE